VRAPPSIHSSHALDALPATSSTSSWLARLSCDELLYEHIGLPTVSLDEAATWSGGDIVVIAVAASGLSGASGSGRD